ncbi:hypothetical protein BHF71_09415 [Vulcanibacillus modesticaldus]|uniref:Ktr system potassium transporter B n=1 Tax=Vulcanibacillus modesticaldus TaxID=337097 RepID=A0A1D2YU65_9BACI|nr:TrkH family potassium uptake protein [Vulcanibacillus modesticaldus]OEF99244.1 hypothetical protein BHF71_09415 [Vulcanibacillus modesticaldus]
MTKNTINSPSRVMVIGFLVSIMVSTLLLQLPIFLEENSKITFGEALFTATSAITVTGLNVIDPGTTFNRWGEILLILLIQIGGLGFMTFTIWFFILFGKKIGLKERLLMQENTGQINLEGIVRLAFHLLWITISFETVGAILLALRWYKRMGWDEAIFQGIFHSVSAFNNAGFSLFSNSLMDNVNDPYVNIVITTLILIGGIGFFVIIDLIGKKFELKQLTLNSKVTLATNFALIVFGTFFFLIMEYKNPATLGPLPFSSKIITSFFQTVTTRTAGFNTINIGDMYQVSLIIIIIYMFIGASSGSTGGGVKVTTVTIIWFSLISVLRGKRDVIIFRRRIPMETVLRSMAIIMLSIIIIISVVILLDITERGTPFIAILFETVSAFGTVGLSMGVTPQLSEVGRVIIIIMMFIGRLGPLTVGYALARKVEKDYFRYPEEKVMIG